MIIFKWIANYLSPLRSYKHDTIRKFILSWAFIWVGFCSHRNSVGLQRDFFLMQLHEIQILFTQNEGLLETCLATDLVTKY